jgi:hypothetical protein
VAVAAAAQVATLTAVRAEPTPAGMQYNVVFLSPAPHYPTAYSHTQLTPAHDYVPERGQVSFSSHNLCRPRLMEASSVSVSRPVKQKKHQGTVPAPYPCPCPSACRPERKYTVALIIAAKKETKTKDRDSQSTLPRPVPLSRMDSCTAKKKNPQKLTKLALLATSLLTNKELANSHDPWRIPRPTTHGLSGVRSGHPRWRGLVRLGAAASRVPLETKGRWTRKKRTKTKKTSQSIVASASLPCKDLCCSS